MGRRGEHGRTALLAASRGGHAAAVQSLKNLITRPWVRHVAAIARVFVVDCACMRSHLRHRAGLAATGAQDVFQVHVARDSALAALGSDGKLPARVGAQQDHQHQPHDASGPLDGREHVVEGSQLTCSSRFSRPARAHCISEQSSAQGSLTGLRKLKTLNLAVSVNLCHPRFDLVLDLLALRRNVCVASCVGRES